MERPSPISGGSRFLYRSTTDEIKFEPHEQEGWCGPACLRFIAGQKGIVTTQSELARMMGTTNHDGTGHYEMFYGVIKLGLQPTQMRDTTVEILWKLQSDYHIIVDWMTGTDESDDGHYDLIHKVEDGKVYLNADTMTIEEFNSKWYDIEADGQRIDKWAMIVQKQPI